MELGQIMASSMGVIFIVILYIIIYYALKIMYKDVKTGGRTKYNSSLNKFGLEITTIGGNQDLEKGSLIVINGVTRIGRAEDNEVILSEPFVSAHHAKIYMKNNLLFVEDLNSTNGLSVNGEKILNKAKLQQDDKVEVGNAKFTVVKIKNRGA